MRNQEKWSAARALIELIHGNQVNKSMKSLISHAALAQDCFFMLYVNHVWNHSLSARTI